MKFKWNKTPKHSKLYLLLHNCLMAERFIKSQLISSWNGSYNAIDTELFWKKIVILYNSSTLTWHGYCKSISKKKTDPST